MKQVIIRNIVNMEKYLVSEPEQQSHADLDVLSLESLWMLHDKLVWDMKDLIPEAQD